MKGLFKPAVRDLFMVAMRTFPVIMAGIVFSYWLFTLIFYPGSIFGRDVFDEILLMSFACTLPFVIFYSKEEINKKQMKIRMVIHFIVLLSILLGLAALWELIDFKKIIEVVLFITLVVGVYAAVLVTNINRDKTLAGKLNEALKRRYQSEEEE